MEQLVETNPKKNAAFSREIFRAPWEVFFRIQADLIAHRPDVCPTAVLGFGKKGIPNKVKVVICIRLIRADRSLYDIVD